MAQERFQHKKRNSKSYRGSRSGYNEIHSYTGNSRSNICYPYVNYKSNHFYK